MKAVKQGLEKFGLTVAASRVTTGNHRIYAELESELALFFGAEDALLLPSGYMAPAAVSQAIAGNVSHVLVDERAHVALLDASQLLGCPILRFEHRNPDHFARTIARCGRGARIVVFTDGMFAFDGSVAPLKAYLRSLPSDGLIVVDDAHGGGVLGPTGKGAVEFEGVSRRRIVQCVTLSKAFGSYGGAVLCTRALRKRIIARSRMFAGSTPIPLPIAAAALAALRTLRGNKTLRARLARNSAFVKSALQKGGVSIPDTPGPIVAIELRGAGANARLKRDLLAAGIYPPFLHYPGGPPDGYFRFAISSEHTQAQLNTLVRVLTSLATRFK